MLSMLLIVALRATVFSITKPGLLMPYRQTVADTQALLGPGQTGS
jgi:hypothetical protein